jgi:hypothetical protein
MTPWERLTQWEMADRTKEQDTVEYITARLQERWPGNYHVVRIWSPAHRLDLYGRYYKIKFDTPEEETMFRLKWG